LAISEKEKKIISYIDEIKDEIISFVCEMIKTPSINPPGDEREMVKLIQEKSNKLGLGAGHIIARVPARPNIIFSIKSGEAGNKIFYNGHLDTKPAGNREEWRTDPLSPKIIDGKLYGLGASDMKGALGALIYSLAAIKKFGLIENGEINLILTADEEGGSKFGAHYLCKEYPLKADIGLVAEPAGVNSSWENIYLAAKRCFGFKTKIYGTQLHSSLTSIIPCVNANEKMAYVILKMAKEMNFKVPAHNFYPQGITKNIAVQLTGGIHYGVNPGYAEFKSELRLPPGIYFKDIFKQVRDFIKKLREEDPDLKIEVYQEIPVLNSEDVPIGEVSEEESFIRGLKEASKEILGFTPPAGGFPGGTDAVIFQIETGIPTIPAFGPGLLSACHQPNEFIFVEDIIRAAKIYALSALKYLDK
jgi:acetylornithine deacetylase/succinyl-diaminopimelate desuccinylase-like protein